MEKNIYKEISLLLMEVDGENRVWLPARNNVRVIMENLLQGNPIRLRTITYDGRKYKKWREEKPLLEDFDPQKELWEEIERAGKLISHVDTRFCLYRIAHALRKLE